MGHEGEGRMGGINREMESESYGLSPLALFSTTRADSGMVYCLVSSSLIRELHQTRLGFLNNRTGENTAKSKLL